MRNLQTHKDLIVWQKSMELVVEIYKLVKLLPKEETYALFDQMRRAVISIPSNIAEGYGRNSTREYIQFLSISPKCAEKPPSLDVAQNPFLIFFS